MNMCRDSEETIVHFFCECEYATKLWNDIKQNIFENNNDIIKNFSNFNILFNIGENICVNKIFTIAKYYMYIARCQDKKVTYKDFFSYLKNVYYMEKALALSKGKIEHHNTIWLCITKLF